MKKKILFRTEASSSVGMGHLIRSISFAQALTGYYETEFVMSAADEAVGSLLRSAGFNYTLAGEEHSDPGDSLDAADIVVLDGYRFTSAYQQKIKQKGKKLVCIDDIHQVHFYADAVLNVSDSVTPADYSAETYTRFYFGTDYVLLREPFVRSARQPAQLPDRIHTAFVSMGGADTFNNTIKAVSALLHAEQIDTIHVVIGSVNRHKENIRTFIDKNISDKHMILHEAIGAEQMNDLMKASQLVICPASGTSMEACAVGVGMIVGTTADNQEGILRSLAKNGCIMNVRDFNKLSVREIYKYIEATIGHLPSVRAMIARQKKLVDGRSPERLVHLIQELT